MKPSEQVIEFLEDVQGMVEATSFEKLSLWQRWHEKVSWVEGRAGFGQTVGYFSIDKDGEEDKYPVVISMVTDVVDGKKILFYEATSVIVDWNAIDAWLKEYVPQKGYANRSNAMNFHNVLH